MIDNNTLDLIKEYLNTRERSNMDSELFYIYQWNPKWASLRDGNFVVQLRE